jgi:DNA-binding CsgD family transcriptional regulator/tetratricopeptide (TPR) repeat protein
MRLLERESLLTRLDSLLDEARSAGRLVLVGGEAGVGKTCLVRRFVETSPDDLRVLWGTCDPLSTPRPLAPFRDMSPAAAILADGPGRHELLTALLGELSIGSVMVVEDAQWADEATLDVLRFVGRRVSGTRSLVVVTYRDNEVGAGHPLRALLGDLATAAGCERLTVPPLTTAAVRVLAAGAPLDPERLHSVTGGNAFFVTEVLAAPGWTVPLSVADAVLARVSRVSAGGRGLVDLVSIAPGGLEPEIAARLTDDGFDGTLDEAVGHGVLVLADTRVRFRHELARLAVEEALAPGRRRTLHARLLEALEARPTLDPARLVHHAHGAGDAERVLRYAPEAAGQASARGSHRQAAGHLERAVACAGALPPGELADLLSLWAEERIGFEEPSERAELLERIIALRRRSGDDLGRGAALALLARTYWAMGRTRDAFDRVAEAVALLETLPPGPELAQAYAAYSLQEMLACNGRAAVRWGERAVELAERVGARGALSMALNSIGWAQITSLEPLEGIEALERAVGVAAEHGEDFEVGRALGNLGAALGEIRRYEQAVEYLERAIAFDEEHDLDGLTGHVRAELARVRFEQGRWDEADRLAAEALGRRDVSPGITTMALCVRGRIRVRRGSPDAASFLDEAWALSGETADLQWTWPLVAGRAEAAWLAGAADEIPQLVGPTYERARQVEHSWATGELGSWLVRAGTLHRLPDGAGTPFALPWREAAEAWERLGCPYEQAEALAGGDEAAMRESLAILMRLGAEPAADRVRETMRRAGIKRVPARPRASTRAAPAQLTRRQLEVLVLVEQGLGNAEIAQRLFISEKTAIHHVTAILRKLGVGTRGEAAAAARKMGIPALEK